MTDFDDKSEEYSFGDSQDESLKIFARVRKCTKTLRVTCQEIWLAGNRTSAECSSYGHTVILPSEHLCKREIRQSHTRERVSEVGAGGERNRGGGNREEGSEARRRSRKGGSRRYWNVRASVCTFRCGWREGTRQQTGVQLRRTRAAIGGVRPAQTPVE